MGRLKCFLGFHNLMKDHGPVNGVLWAFCSRCGGRFGGEYDPYDGRTNWKPR